LRRNSREIVDDDLPKSRAISRTPYRKRGRSRSLPAPRTTNTGPYAFEVEGSHAGGLTEPPGADAHAAPLVVDLVTASTAFLSLTPPSLSAVPFTHLQIQVLRPLESAGFTTHRFRTACERVGIRQSMGRAGSALDNAAIESWPSTLEVELHALEQVPEPEPESRVAAWIDEYSRDRRHSVPDALPDRLSKSPSHKQAA
jgi:hypothetical protein